MRLSEGTNSPTSSKQTDLQPMNRGLDLQKKLEEKEVQREEASRQIFILKKLFQDVEDEIYTLENEMEAERTAFIQQVHDIFFDYLPGHSHNYSHTIGPIDWDIVENETLIGDIDIGELVGDCGCASRFCLHRYASNNKGAICRQKDYKGTLR